MRLMKSSAVRRGSHALHMVVAIQRLKSTERMPSVLVLPVAPAVPVTMLLVVRQGCLAVDSAAMLQHRWSRAPSSVLELHAPKRMLQYVARRELLAAPSLDAMPALTSSSPPLSVLALPVWTATLRTVTR